MLTKPKYDLCGCLGNDDQLLSYQQFIHDRFTVLDFPGSAASQPDLVLGYANVLSLLYG